MLNEETEHKLKEISRKVRHCIMEMLLEAGSGHPGGSLSCVDVLTALYFYKIKHDPKNPCWDERDRFILSKGHAAPALYAVLAEAGYFPAEELKNLRKIGSILQGHPDKNKTPGVEVSTGSLGQGLSVSVGIALAGKMDKKSYRVYALLGDGECDEGQVWEAAMAASNYKLDNLTVIIDRNGLQIDGPTEKVMSLESTTEKWKSFGWNVINIDGHNFYQIICALNDAEKTKRQPTAIIAHTIKGKGFPFMEGVAEFHGKIPDKKQLSRALEELKS